MGKVNLDGLKPGMKLEKDVQERSGRVLLRAGTTTTTGSKLRVISQRIRKPSSATASAQPATIGLSNRNLKVSNNS
jgi:hypothetical protein